MKIVVYGTLRSDDPTFGSFRGSTMGEFGKLLGLCTIPGTLINVGAFPALLEGDGVVHGQLWEIFPGLEREALKTLDQIEGNYAGLVEKDLRNLPERERARLTRMAENQSMYLRRTVRTLETSEEAFTYVWNRPSDRYDPVPNGDWLEHRRREEARRVARNLTFERSS